MIAKVVFFFSVVVAAHATTLLGSGILAPGLLNSGILAPGLLNSGILAPGLLNAGIVAPTIGANGASLLSSPISTSSIVATPGAITTDKRVIGSSGLLAGTPLAYSNGIIGSRLISNGIISNGIISNGIISNGIVSNGIIGASPIGLRNAGILAVPGVVRTILK